MKRFLFFALVFSVVACQKDPSRTNTELQGASQLNEPQLVQAADGTLYSKSCLQENATQIKSEGASAMNACKMKVTWGTSSSGGGEIERTRFFYSNSYAWIYYPPTYWSSSSSNNNLFCGWIFGANNNFNCYALFGYNTSNYPTYSYYYNPTCNYCLYSVNPTKCQNKCYNYQYFYTYY